MDDLVGMQVEQADGDVVVVRLTGELDIATAEPMGRQIAEAVPSSARGVVIDMTHLGFMDSSGVSMLFGLARRVGSRRQELRVVAVPGHPVARVLEIVEFERAAPVHRDVSSAVAEIVKPGSQQPRG
jgi:anti-sigma B factor antagonist